MADRRLREVYKILGLTATVEILKSIEKGKTQYRNFDFASVSTINTRIRQLLDLNFIEHHIVKEDKRKEWYTLTEKGKKVVKGIKYLDKAVLEQYNP
jgi:DNA-binding HxlR family transcriptional regulator